MFNLDFLRRSSLMDTTLRAAPDKSYAFSTNYHAYIEIPTWYTCTHTSILFDLHKFLFLLRSREATCPPRIAGAGQPCYDRSLFLLILVYFHIADFLSLNKILFLTCHSYIQSFCKSDISVLLLDCSMDPGIISIRRYCTSGICIYIWD